MLKKSQRLNSLEVKKVFQNGRGVSRPLFTLIYLYSPGNQQFKATVVVSNKVSRKSPARNRIRRMVYGILEELNNDRPKSYIVIIVKRIITPKDRKELKDQIAKLFNSLQ